MQKLRILTIFIISGIFLNLSLIAQIPTHLEVDTDPVNFYEWPNLLVYIVLPVLLVVFYIWWRRNKARQKNKRLNNLDNKEK